MRNDIETKVGPSPLTVIVAEKYPISRAALAALLSYDGCRVFQADNARAAISHIMSVDNLGVLLADLDKPGWRSIIRRAIQTTNALVIALEGNVRFSKMCDLKQLGIRLCMQKPLVYEDVRRAIIENSGWLRDEGPRRKAA